MGAIGTKLPRIEGRFTPYFELHQNERATVSGAFVYYPIGPMIFNSHRLRVISVLY